MDKQTKQKPAHERLAEWLKTNKVKQMDFASTLGMHHVSLSRIVNGKRKISGATARQIETETGGAVKVQEWF